MRIGIDARLRHYRRGGISQYTQQLVQALSAVGGAHDFRVLQMRQDPDPLVVAPNFHSVSCWTPCHHPLERWALAAEILPLALDVLHSTDFIPPAAGYRRSVITVHDLNFLHYPEFLTADSRNYYVEQIGWAARRARRIIAVSEATRHDLLERLCVPPEKVAVVYEAAGPEFRPLPEAAVNDTLARYRLAPGYILFVGTLEPRKNLPALVAAYAELRARHPGLPPLVLAGRKGWLFQEVYMSVVRFNLAAHVRFLHDFPHDDLPALYGGAGALALTSHYEGFGLPALEALQCGTPVVVSDRAALPEVVGDAGLLVDPRDTAAVAAALERALGDSELRAQLRERGLARAACFSWERAARETLEQYQLAAAA